MLKTKVQMKWPAWHLLFRHLSHQRLKKQWRYSTMRNLRPWANLRAANTTSSSLLTVVVAWEAPGWSQQKKLWSSFWGVCPRAASSPSSASAQSSPYSITLIKPRSPTMKWQRKQRYRISGCLQPIMAAPISSHPFVKCRIGERKPHRKSASLFWPMAVFKTQTKL